MVVARRSLAIGLLLGLALPALALGSTCTCPRTPAAHSCCRSLTTSVAVTAPQGCCQAAAPAESPDADRSRSALAPSSPEPAKLLAAEDLGRWLLSIVPPARIPSPREAAETPPDLPVRNCALLI